MTKNLSNSYSVINLHKKPSTKSEVVTQMLYGESMVDGLKLRSMKTSISVTFKIKIFPNF